MRVGHGRERVEYHAEAAGRGLAEGSMDRGSTKCGSMKWGSMKRAWQGLLWVGWLLAASSAQAQEYPSKVITIVVPFSAGGPTDTVTRLVAQSMARALAGNVVVENVPGG